MDFAEAIFDHSTPAHVRQENAFLPGRIAPLQGDVWDLSGRLALALREPSATTFAQRRSDGPFVAAIGASLGEGERP